MSLVRLAPVFKGGGGNRLPFFLDINAQLNDWFARIVVEGILVYIDRVPYFYL